MTAVPVRSPNRPTRHACIIVQPEGTFGILVAVLLVDDSQRDSNTQDSCARVVSDCNRIESAHFDLAKTMSGLRCERTRSFTHLADMELFDALNALHRQGIWR